jgi:hypothetical protein
LPEGLADRIGWQLHRLAARLRQRGRRSLTHEEAFAAGYQDAVHRLSPLGRTGQLLAAGSAD